MSVLNEFQCVINHLREEVERLPSRTEKFNCYRHQLNNLDATVYTVNSICNDRENLTDIFKEIVNRMKEHPVRNEYFDYLKSYFNMTETILHVLDENIICGDDQDVNTYRSLKTCFDHELNGMRTDLLKAYEFLVTCTEDNT